MASEAVYALFADDERVRERIMDPNGSRIRVGGLKLPEESDDKSTRIDVTDVNPA